MVPAIEQLVGLRSGYEGPRRFWFTLPRGHDKTGIIARLCNYVLKFSKNKISGAATAADKGQARLLLESMKREIDLNPWLKRSLYAYNYQITGPSGHLEVIATDANTASGRKDDFTVCDEIVYWRHKGAFDMLLSGVTKRPDAVMVVITNAGIQGTWQWELFQQIKADPYW